MSYPRSQSMPAGVAPSLRTWGPFPPQFMTRRLLWTLAPCCAKDRWQVPVLLLNRNRNCTLHQCNSFQWWSLPAKRTLELPNLLHCVYSSEKALIYFEWSQELVNHNPVQVRCELVMWHLSKGMFPFQPFVLLRSFCEFYLPKWYVNYETH